MVAGEGGGWYARLLIGNEVSECYEGDYADEHEKKDCAQDIGRIARHGD
jgi:hypothetical protein